MRSLTRQFGISLLEVLLALTIGAVVLVSATRYYVEASSGTKVVMAQNQFNQVYKAALEWYAQQSKKDFTSITYKALEDSGLVESKVFDLPWGKDAIVIAPNPVADDAFVGFHITVEMSTLALCNRLKIVLVGILFRVVYEHKTGDATINDSHPDAVGRTHYSRRQAKT